MKSTFLFSQVLLALSATAPLLLLGCGGENDAEPAAFFSITIGPVKNLSMPYGSTDPADFVRFQNELAEAKIITENAIKAMIEEAGGQEVWNQLVAANDRGRLKVLMSKHGFDYSEVDPSVEASSLRKAEVAKSQPATY
jgi:hypothetical protein